MADGGGHGASAPHEDGTLGGAAAAAGSAVKKSSQGLLTRLHKVPIKTMNRVMRGVNAVNGGLLVLSAILAWSAMFSSSTTASGSAATGASPTPTAFLLACYLFVFGALLLAFELRLARWDKFIRKDCGFMYSFFGRTAFIVMVAVMSIAINGVPGCLAIGIVTVINGVFNCLIISTHPGMKEQQTNVAAANTAGDGKTDPGHLSEAEVAAYLRAHPELVTAAQAGADAPISSRAVYTQPTSATPGAQPGDIGLGMGGAGGYGDPSLAAFHANSGLDDDRAAPASAPPPPPPPPPRRGGAKKEENPFA